MPKKRPYGQFCPVAQTLDVVGDKWTLLIVRELLVGPVRYSELLRALAPVATDVLAKRLRDMTDAQLIQTGDDGYELTADGWDLLPVLRSLANWGISRMQPPNQHSRQRGAHALQVLLLANPEPIPERGTLQLVVDESSFVLASNHDGLHAHRGSATKPKATITTDGPTLWAIATGALRWTKAKASGSITVEGDSLIARSLLAGRIPAQLGPQQEK